MNQDPVAGTVQSTAQLIQACRAIEGLSFGQLAAQLQRNFPVHTLQRKGWVGLAIEKALGTDAGNRCLPDFTALGIELKTIPLNSLGQPAESTFVTHIPLLSIHQQSWSTSQCWSKLRRVLWIPIEGDRSIPYAHRRIGRALLWSPSTAEAHILERDWSELVDLIAMGKVHEVHAGIGEYLQIRPKAAHGQSLCYAFDEQGQKIQTLPRGFYLRSSFTANVIKY